MINIKHTLLILFAAGWVAGVPQCEAEWRASGGSTSSTIRPAVNLSPGADRVESPSASASPSLPMSRLASSSVGGAALHESDSHSHPPKALVAFRIWNFHRFTGPLGLIRLKFYSFRHPFWPMGRILIHKHFGNCPHAPEPSSMVLAGIGGLTVGVAALRRRKPSAQKSDDASVSEIK